MCKTNGEQVIPAVEEMKHNAEKEERIMTLLKSIKNLMKNAGWSVEYSMEILDVSESDRKELQSLIG